MLERPESFKYDVHRKNFEDWVISRQLFVKLSFIQLSGKWNDVSTVDNSTKMILHKKALRDCTPHIQTVLAVDDEPVQTTTQNILRLAKVSVVSNLRVAGSIPARLTN